MHSFPVPVLGLADGFLSPFPDSLPQLFLRCLPYALAFGLFPSDPLSFVRFSSGSGYSASVSSFPFSSLFRLTVASQMRPFCLPASRPLLFRSTWFPMLRFRFPVLSFLSVSFRPSQLRSHSRSTGAYLLLSPSVLSPSFPLSFVRFFSGSDYSASALSFPFFPFSPGSGSSGACLSPFFSACYHAYLPGLVLSLLRSLSPVLCLASQRLHSSSAFPYGFRPHSLSKHLRVWILGWVIHPEN